MIVYSTYRKKIKNYNSILKATVEIYRRAVTFFLSVCLKEWDAISKIDKALERQSYVEKLTHKTKKRPVVPYDFDDADKKFYKFPSYLRRGAISEALGKVASYQSQLSKWRENPKGKEPGLPKAGYVYPCMYRVNMYQEIDAYTAKIKVFIRNTWDWITVSFKKSDVDYIKRHCSNRKECAPTLQKKGKEWYLAFAYEERVELNETKIENQTILSIDLGLNQACTCCVMKADGTILDRKFLKLSKEQDSLTHHLNQIKKASQHGARKMPRLWARVKGINQDIAAKTAQFIMKMATDYSVDVLVFEYLDLNGKKRGTKKQRLHHWKARKVQNIVTNQAHRLGMRIRRVCAFGTSRYAYDGSGVVTRGVDGNYSLCQFETGKVYHCDLSASYNIGARYFIREILKSFSEKERLDMEAKVPSCAKRSTCTLSTLLHLNAVL